jgi:hypothetical protein
MPRQKNLLSKRHRNATFTQAEVRAFIERLAASRRAKPVRKQEEFTRQLTQTVQYPRIPTAAYSWCISDIVNARDSQILGRFQTPARLAESFRTDDALAVAYDNRLAPQRMIGVEIEEGKGARSGAIASEADALFGPKGIALSDDTMSDIVGGIANHDLAIGVNMWTPRKDGSRVDVQMHAWPIEFVWWDSSARCLMTRVDSVPEPDRWRWCDLPGDPYPLDTGCGSQMPIIHGDGRWVVFAKHEITPWRNEAALIPAALVWARHAFAARDWGKGSSSHGNAKVVGTLPEGVPLQGTTAEGEDGWSREAAAFMELLQDIQSLDTPVGIMPYGSTIDYLVNSSKAWEVWERLMLNAERAAARIYLGTDGMLGAQGGAPGVDVQALFGVARTRVEGDLQCITRALRTGLIEPWTAINFGDSSQAPERKYLIPDVDSDAVMESTAKRESAMWASIKSAKETGMQGAELQAYAVKLADNYEVTTPVVWVDTGPTPPDATLNIRPSKMYPRPKLVAS